MAKPHPLCAQLRELRLAAGLSLTEAQERYGFNAILVGSYERGDRVPPLPKIDALFRAYGYELVAAPMGSAAVRRSADMVEELRAIAHQLETTARDVPTMSETVASDSRLRLPR